jgi:hypothetical protein
MQLPPIPGDGEHDCRSKAFRPESLLLWFLSASIVEVQDIAFLGQASAYESQYSIACSDA